MSDYTGGKNIAEYDWCWLFISDCTGTCEKGPTFACSCIDEHLHAAHPNSLQSFDDWDGDAVDGSTACDRPGRLTIPGLGSRMEDPRCASCCDRLNLPHGNGSPKNDKKCRDALGMPPSLTVAEMLARSRDE